MNALHQGLRSAVASLIILVHLTTSVWAQAPVTNQTQTASKDPQSSFHQVQSSSDQTKPSVHPPSRKAKRVGISHDILSTGAQSTDPENQHNNRPLVTVSKSSMEASVAAAAAPVAPAYNFDNIASTRSCWTSTR